MPDPDLNAPQTQQPPGQYGFAADVGLEGFAQQFGPNAQPITSGPFTVGPPTGAMGGAADAATNYSDEIAQAESQFISPEIAGAAGQQYAQDIVAMEMAGRNPGGMLTLPPGTSEADLMQLLSYAEDFANQAGWRYYPTSSMIQQMLSSNVAAMGQQGVFRFLAGVNGVAGKYPWIANGMSYQQWQGQRESFADVIGEYTGNRNLYGGLVSTAMANNWSTQHVIDQLTKNPVYAKKMPWLKYGLTYQAFQDFKRQNQQIAQQEFGRHVSDAQFAHIYGNPAPSSPNVGGSIDTTSSQLVSTGTGSRSEVR